MEIEEQLQRLNNVLAADAGLFVLAVHSFAEGYMNEEMAGFEEFQLVDDYGKVRDICFYQKINHYADRLKQRLGYNPYDRLRPIKDTYGLTNVVRHQFLQQDDEAVKASIHSFQKFCQVSRISSPVLEDFTRYLDTWVARPTAVQLQADVDFLKANNFQLIKQIQQLKAGLDIDAANELRSKLAEQDRQIAELEKQSSDRKERVDELRRERRELQEELRKHDDDLAQLHKFRLVQVEIQRLSYLTRSRRDFEQSFFRLSPEQQDALKRILNGGSFHVKGGAGSGKTVVLLQALKQRVLDVEDQPGLFDAPVNAPGEIMNARFAFFTFTRTLVKYNRYISNILEISSAPVYMDTIDHFLNSLWKSGNKNISIEYDKAEVIKAEIDYLAEDTDLPQSTDELLTEIDAFIWGYNLTREEYVEQRVSRAGLKAKVNPADRAAIWDIQEALAERLPEMLMVTRNLAAFMLLQTEDESSAHMFDTIFVDEVQDIPPVLLTLLKQKADNLVIAGDIGQSIYGLQSPRMRAGIDMRGRTSILKLNFRNTAPMVELAQKFRGKVEQRYRGANESSVTDEYMSTALRPGPPVGLFAGSSQEMKAILLDRIHYYTSILEYDRENICVIAPSHTMIRSLQDSVLSKARIDSVQVNRRLTEEDFRAMSDDASRHDTGDSFDFSNSKGIRLVTLHSAKGLDFPVVLLYLPFLAAPGGKDLDKQVAEELKANLLYVALTRALDHLDIICDPSKDALLADIIEK